MVTEIGKKRRLGEWIKKSAEESTSPLLVRSRQGGLRGANTEGARGKNPRKNMSFLTNSIKEDTWQERSENARGRTKIPGVPGKRKRFRRG